MALKKGREERRKRRVALHVRHNGTGTGNIWRGKSSVHHFFNYSSFPLTRCWRRRRRQITAPMQILSLYYIIYICMPLHAISRFYQSKSGTFISTRGEKRKPEDHDLSKTHSELSIRCQILKRASSLSHCLSHLFRGRTRDDFSAHMHACMHGCMYMYACIPPQYSIWGVWICSSCRSMFPHITD